MESSVPMDRLLCGDVGFGKTEVALRAVMKCILAGKQAAILVPTTVLARQHYLTAMQRFQGHPITIELLTRYKTGAEQTKLLKKLEAGSIDLVIGTHKLFNKKIKFKDLGLLVVDEEQRFGVGHKETLKEISKNVDVLTLSATPIPRTLNMALSGIRDMSSMWPSPDAACSTSCSSRTTACCSMRYGASCRAAVRSIICTTAWSPSSAVQACGSSGFRMHGSALFTEKWGRRRSQRS